MVLADTGEVMDDKEKNIDIMKDEFLAVENMKTISMGVAMVMRVVMLYYKPISLKQIAMYCIRSTQYGFWINSNPSLT